MIKRSLLLVSILLFSAVSIGFSDAARAQHPTVTATATPIACAEGDELVWVDTDKHIGYRHDDARFAATLHGEYRCRALLSKQDVMWAPFLAATPAPRPFTFRSANVNNPACNCVGVTVYYATDRKRGATLNPQRVSYTSEHARTQELSLGNALVTIPRDHRMGNIERPEWFLLEFKEDASKHIIIHMVREESPRGFYGDVARQASEAKGEALIFIHGYNVDFDSAIERVAQMKYDFGFAGPVIAYSWPSKGEPTPYAYTADENSALWTTEHFRAFLERLARTTGITRVHIIAHSMGNRVLTDALAEEGEARHKLPKLGTLIFAAPDVDRDVFLQRLGMLGQMASHQVLYASSRDKALWLSERVHAGQRAGDAQNMVLAPSLESIDASAVDTSFDGHGYYADNTSVFGDLYYVMQGMNPPRFRLRAVTAEQPLFWRIAP